MRVLQFSFGADEGAEEYRAFLALGGVFTSTRTQRCATLRKITAVFSYATFGN